ncbi:MAG: metallophosphoesterase family protein, partial [Terriglobia bacterium]
MAFFCAHSGDFHLEEDHYFRDTAQCLEWFVKDGIEQGAQLFVLDGDLTTYKQTIEERNLWIDQVIRMARHAPVILVAGNHGKELEGDLYSLSQVRGEHPIFLCTEPEFIDLPEVAVAVFPYPRKSEFMDTAEGPSMEESFAKKLGAFNERFRERSGCYRLFFGHFGVAGARVSSGQPLAGRCAEYPLDPLRGLQAQYVGLSHIHLRQQLAPRVWYAGSLSRCDYSETEDKGYHLISLKEPMLRPDLSDLEVEFRISPTRSMIELHAVYEAGEFRFASPVDADRLKDSRVKVVVRVPSELHSALSREEQDRLKEQLLAARPAELKMKIEHETEEASNAAPLSVAKTAE